MAFAACSSLYAENAKDDDTIVTMRVDTTVIKKTPQRSGKISTVTYYTSEEYARKTGRPTLPEADCDTIYYIYRDTTIVAKSGTVSTPVPMDTPVTDSTDCHADNTVGWAVKTNLLWNALLAPNLEVEFPIDRKRRWTVMGEWWNPWYTWHHNSRAYQPEFGIS